MKKHLYFLTALLSLLTPAATAQLWVGSNATFFVGTGATVSVGGTLTNAGTFTNGGHVYLRGDLTNTGTLTSTAGDWTLNGSAAQMLVSPAFTVRNFTLNSTASGDAVTLGVPLTVSGTATFTDGVLKTDATNLLLLADNATSSGASNASHVRGPVRKVGDDAFTFPLGNGTTYRPASVAPQSGTGTDAFTAEYKEANPGNAGSRVSCLENVSTSEYWQVDRTAGSAPAVVGLAYQNVATVGFDTEDLRVGRYNGSEWEALNCTDDGGVANGLVITNGATSAFGLFSLVEAFSLLPSISVTYPTLTTHCAGATLSLTVATSGTFNAGNQFTALLSDASGSFSSSTNLGTVVVGTNSVTLPGNAPAGSGYQLKVVSSAPVVNSNPGGPFTINAPPTVADPADQSVCAGGTTQAVAFAPLQNARLAATNDRLAAVYSGEGLTFEWTNDTPGIGLAASGTGDIQAFTATNPGTLPLVATITVTPKIAGCSDGPPKTFTIVVNPAPVLIQPTDYAFCAGETTPLIEFAVQRSGPRRMAATPDRFRDPAPTFAWTNDTPGIGLGASGTGDLPAFVATNPGTLPLVATITVTPTAGSGCSNGTSRTFKITVNPIPSVADPADQTVCAGAQTGAVSFVGTGGTYEWTNSTPGIGLGAEGTGNIAAFTATNPGTTPLAATITVTPKSGTCTGMKQTFTLAVNPNPVVSAATATPNPICAGNSLNFSATASGGTGTLAYAWTGPNGYQATGSAATRTVGANDGGQYTITVTDANTCSTIAKTATVVVNSPTAIQSITPSQQACANVPVTLAVQATGGNLTYQWYRYINGTNDQIVAGATSASLTVTPTTAVAYYVVVTGACGTLTSERVTLSVMPNLTLRVTSLSNQVCEGGNLTLSVSASGGAGTTIQYSWRKGTPEHPGPVLGTGSSFTIANAQIADAATYFASAQAACAPVTVSIPVTVRYARITGQPQSVNLCTGSTTLTVAVQAVGVNVSYQWKRNGTNIMGAAAASHTVAANRPGTYTVEVRVSCGNLLSDPAVVGCSTSRLVGEAPPALNVVPNPVAGREIRCRVVGMESPVFSLTNVTGQPVPIRAETGQEPGYFVVRTVSQLPVGVYILQASDGSVRRAQRVMLMDE